MKMLLAINIIIAGLLLCSAARASESAPIFAGIWSQKEAGVGGLFIDQTWDELLSRRKELRQNQYLADVEVYRKNGEWRFAGAWRVGEGNGALFLLEWDEFQARWNELKDTQDLIDVEIFESGGNLKYLGVWRDKQGNNNRSGAFFTGLDWEQFVARWKELGANQYLSDVETYVSNGKRLFAGVWRVGSGNGALFWMTDWQQFADMNQSLDASQDMLDFEMFQTDVGQWNFLGVWRKTVGPRRNSAGPSDTLHASNHRKNFRPLTDAQFLAKWNELKPDRTLINITVVTPSIALLGDTRCKYGDVDCNRCAIDVTAQFKQAFETGHRPLVSFKADSWNFSGDRKYQPDGLKPEDAFKPFDTGISSKHIQGLVRTNDSRIPYAGSHSHEDKGSIFFVGADKSGGNSLYSLHASNHHHPSGVAVLGDGLFLAEGDRLRWFGISAAIDNQNHGYEIPKTDPRKKGLQGAGGGLGLAKLQDGTYLLVVSAPGDGFRLGTTPEGIRQNLEPRFTRFYRITGNDAGHPDKIQFLDEFNHGDTDKHPKTPMEYSENLSLVTECGTGRLYTIHTTGDYLLNGDGYWRLSRIDSGPDGLRLRHISMAKQSQDSGDCHHRSSATVHVDKNGQLEFLCSERSALKRNPTGTFNFKEGRR